MPPIKPKFRGRPPVAHHVVVRAQKAKTSRQAGPVDPAVAAILDAAAEVLAEVGLQGLQLREVAARARVSLSTVYKHFGSRDALVVRAMERWMAQQVFEPLPVVRADESLCDALIRVFRSVVEPWRRSPTMLAVLMEVLRLPGGDSLAVQAEIAVHAKDYFDGYDADFAADVNSVLTYLAMGLLSLCGSGRMDLDEMLRVYERAVVRLTGDAVPTSK
jgi:AcrR family transcriptional regulator